MLELLARDWGWVLLRGVFTIIFGVLALVWPGITLLALVVLFGVYAIIDGVTAIALGARRSTGRGWPILLGVLGVIAGIIALVWPGITAIALLYVIAFWALVIGIDYLVQGIRLGHDAQGRWLMILSGVAALLLGVLLLFQPGEGALTLVFTIGILAIIWGAITVATAIRLRKLKTTLDT
ncbi:MAG TPA: HdeD family acid-resistance protein [Glycomyces sp.]|nr:HdeD family acid-resistance protein [Glycomyces sp.]